jgi:hypothetical protein
MGQGLGGTLYCPTFSRGDAGARPVFSAASSVQLSGPTCDGHTRGSNTAASEALACCIPQPWSYRCIIRRVAFIRRQNVWGEQLTAAVAGDL